MSRRRLSQDLLAGLMFVAWGILGLWLSRDYPVGTTVRMGPGYLPALLCWAMITLGGAIALRGVITVRPPVEGVSGRALMYVGLGLVAFAMLIERAGLPLSIAACVFIGSFGGREARAGEAAALAVCLAAAGTLIFVYGLGLPIALWPRWM
jgi:putative tricarboxylic transport membrane protein